MLEEMATLDTSNMWDLVLLPVEKTTIDCHWAYTIKVGPDGKIDRFKA